MWKSDDHSGKTLQVRKDISNTFGTGSLILEV